MTENHAKQINKKMIFGGIRAQEVTPEGDYTLYNSDGTSLHLSHGQIFGWYQAAQGSENEKRSATAQQILDSIFESITEEADIVIEMGDNGKLKNVTIVKSIL